MKNSQISTRNIDLLDEFDTLKLLQKSFYDYNIETRLYLQNNKSKVFSIQEGGSES